MKIAVFGTSHATDNAVIANCEDIGIMLANSDHSVLTGGGPGYPDLVAAAANKAGTKTVAYCIGEDINQHREYFDINPEHYSEFVFLNTHELKSDRIHQLHQRSLNLCFDCYVAIVIGGRVGTLYEVSIVSGLSKDLFILNNSGGVTGKTLKAFMAEGHKTDSKIEYFNTVDELQMLLD